MPERTAFDFVVVGGGSAGCVLANRLSAKPENSVLLLEAGPDTEPFWVRTPAGVGNLFFDASLNWKYFTEPEAHLGGRQIYCPRGKIIGGSSAINGMLYVRGFANDYDRWAAHGNSGWSWSEIQPYFTKSETCISPRSEHRGKDGPLRISQPPIQHRATDAFIATGVHLGLHHNPDIAGATQDGIGYAQHTIGAGVRSSTARAYLRPARQRSNLTVIGDALARRVLVDGRTATGVEFQQGNLVRSVRARREVLVCAGAIGSPHLLMLSGIGDPAHLRQAGVEVVHALPGVGANLQDHLGINAGYEVADGHSLNAALSGWRKYGHGARYLLNHSGPLSVGVSHAVAFVRSHEAIDVPDIQLTFRPLSLAFDSKRKLRMHPFPGMQIAGAMLRPQSRGRIRLRSRNPSDPPVIHGNFLSDSGDERVMLAIVEWIRRITRTKPLANIVVREDLPGPRVATRDEILAFIRQRAETIYHPVGTCRMGTDSQAVVDERLCLRGLQALRVVDASIMPQIVSGNTNAPTIAIAEKAADMILQEAKRVRTHGDTPVNAHISH